MTITFTNELPDIPRIYTAIAQWGACMIFIFLLPKRFPAIRLAVIGVVALALQCLFLVFTGGVGIFYLWIIFMAIAVLLMISLIFCCCKIGWWEAFYSALQAFVLAEFATSLSWQIYCFYFYSTLSVAGGLCSLLFFCIIIDFFYYWMLHSQNKSGTGLEIYKEMFGRCCLLHC